MKLLLKKPVPGTLGAGNKASNLEAAESKHDGAMVFATASTQPARTNGLVATMLPVSSERSPAFIRAVGTVAVCDNDRSVRADW
jgi:hypothetical protein